MRGKLAISACLWAALAAGAATRAADQRHTAPQDGAAPTLTTLPNWTTHFTIQGVSYSATLLGTDPEAGEATTVIPTIIVPIRLTVPDYTVNGAPLVLDARHVTAAMLRSPVFHVSDYDSGRHLQFADAMLHAEYPTAPHGWHLRLSPAVAPVFDITTTRGQTKVVALRSGKYAVTIADDTMDRAVVEYVRRHFEPGVFTIFITINAADANALGYHAAVKNAKRTGVAVFAFSSWLDGAGDAFGVVSPNAATLAHQVAGAVHDPFGTSLTLVWGDPFDHNTCFATAIEPGDATQHAPPKTRNTRQTVVAEGKHRIYTLQNEALLPFFTRQNPSNAINNAYSWPDESAIVAPAATYCGK